LKGFRKTGLNRVKGWYRPVFTALQAKIYKQLVVKKRLLPFLSFFYRGKIKNCRE